MVAILCALIGAIFGTIRAKRRNGNRLDMLQYASVFALIFAIVGMFITIMIERNL